MSFVIRNPRDVLQQGSVGLTWRTDGQTDDKCPVYIRQATNNLLPRVPTTAAWVAIPGRLNVHQQRPVVGKKKLGGQEVAVFRQTTASDNKGFHIEFSHRMCGQVAAMITSLL